MDKNEILEKSRKENKQQDIFELEVINKGSNIAMRVGLLVCCLISVISAVFITEGNYWVISAMPSWTIYFSMLGTLFTYKFIKRKKRHELLLGALYYVAAVFMFLRFALFISGVWC